MNISGILERFGIQNERLIEVINVLFTMLVVSLIGWLAYVVAKKFLPKLIKKIAGATRQHWSEWLLDQRFFNRLALLIMPIVLRTGLSPIKWEHMATINRILDIWIVVAIALLVSAFMSGINRVYEKMASVRDKPVKIITQVITVVIWCAVALIIISIFTRESLGDWIVMPSRGVDGEVTEIGLTTVKVQNWDKTITTVPTHKLVSESFTNWRGMEESGGRRIKRSVNIDVSSIHYLSDAELATLGSSQLLRRYMEKKLAELAEYNANRASDLDERRLTNIGTFREYMEQWIESNPDINQDMTHMVRQLQPGPTGLPLEIYCFSAKQRWIDYENVQSDLFDHVYAVMPLFNLRAFQYSGEVAAQEQ